MKKKVLIIIPVYNEEAIIGQFIDQIRAAKIEEFGDLLMIDDGSTDQTRTIIREKEVDLLKKPFNLGYGSTLQLGYKYAVHHDYQYVLQLDGDGQHDLANIPVLYEALVESTDAPDIVIGSRFLSEENQMSTAVLKKIAISFFRKIIHFFTGQVVTDPTSGLQGLNRSAFHYYSQCNHFDYQYPDVNMIIQMLLMGYSIKEVPGKMHNRTTGTSMHSGVWKPIKYMVLMSLSTLGILIRKRRYYYRLRQKTNDGELSNE